MFEFLRARRKAENKTAGQLAVDRLRWVLAHDRAECWGDRAVRLARKSADGKTGAQTAGTGAMAGQKTTPVLNLPAGKGARKGE